MVCKEFYRPQLCKADSYLQQHSEMPVDTAKWLEALSQAWSVSAEQNGAVALATGIIAAVGLGIDVISWYRTDRASQNAADAVAVAVAPTRTGSYDSEAVPGWSDELF